MIKEIKEKYIQLGLQEIYTIIYNEALDRIIRNDADLLRQFTVMMGCKLKSEYMGDMKVKEIAKLAADYRENTKAYNDLITTGYVQQKLTNEFNKIESSYFKTLKTA